MYIITCNSMYTFLDHTHNIQHYNIILHLHYIGVSYFIKDELYSHYQSSTQLYMFQYYCT